MTSVWGLQPGLIYLNHGSYGACPAPVREAADCYRAMMERDAVRFMLIDLWELTDAARAALAPLVGCRAEDMVFVTNATTAVASVMANIDLGPGDEILANNHEYAACLSIVRRAAARAGARVVEARLPFPLPQDSCEAEDALVEAIVSRVTERTRLCLLSHVTSGTAMVLPAARIVRELRGRGVETLLDAAHSPGFVPLDVESIGAAYTTANCHKWLCAPKAAAMLHVRPEFQDGFRPPAISVYEDRPRPDRSAFQTAFDFAGTDDYAPRCAVPDAIRFLESLDPEGIRGLMRRNRAMALRGRDVIVERLGVRAPVPDTMLGAMAAIPLPDHDPEVARRLAERPTRYQDALWDALVERHRIQVPIWVMPGSPPGMGRFVRISAQAYNRVEEYHALAGALLDELERERSVICLD